MGNKKKTVKSLSEVKEISEKVTKKKENGGTMLAGGCCEDHKGKVGGVIDAEYLNPPTKVKPLKPIHCDGDAKWCETCKSNTVHGSGKFEHCIICTPFTEEQMLKYAGNIHYLKKKYPKYVTVK